MNTPYMAQADAKHKPLCQARARQDRQPRASENQCNDGGMHPLNCAALATAATDTRITATEFRVLAIIGAGVCARASIATACGVSVPTVARAIAKLVSLGLLARQIVPGKASALSLPTRITADAGAPQTRITHDTTTPDDTTTRIMDDATAGRTRITDDATTSIMGASRITHDTTTPVDNSPRACIVHVPARAQTLNSNTTVSSNSEREESSLERGLGSRLFGEAALPDAPAPATPTSAKPKRRPRRAKFYATDEAMPAEPNAEMLAYAAGKGMRNGTLAEQHGKFRRWHIRERTLIACLEQRWETWVDNWARNNPMKPEGGAPPGYRLGGIGPDGKQRYLKDQRLNFYR